MSRDTDFNLLDDPWIIVLGPDGRERPVSILGLFDDASDLVAIGGEVPTQSFAVLRLLLAFLHRAIDGPRDTDEWKTLWQAKELPLSEIRRYADRVRHRFGLFDARSPFFQVPDLHTGKNEVSGLEKIVADVPNGEPYFTTRSASSLKRIDAAEAARWLVHVHAFDPSGIKSGAVGDPMVKSGKGYPIGVGWSGQLGAVWPESGSLRETLLLNLIAQDVANYVRIGGPDDLPPWERAVDDARGQQEPPRPPRGAIDLYTWQTRRVRLAGDRDGVTGVVLANGDRIVPQNRQGDEPHTAWRHSEAQSSKHKTVVYMPRGHDPERSVWRGLAALLPSVSSHRVSRSGAPQRFLAPGVLNWVAELVAEGVLPENYKPRLRVCGAAYGAQNATYAEIVADVLPLPVMLLREDRPAAGQTAESAVASAENVARLLAHLAENLAQAAGALPDSRPGARSDSGPADRAREALFSTLDAPYRSWLGELTPESDLTAALARWQSTLLTRSRPLADALVTAAPPAAWTGRTIRGRLVTVALARVWFDAALRTTLPLAHPTVPDKALVETTR